MSIIEAQKQKDGNIHFPAVKGGEFSRKIISTLIQSLDFMTMMVHNRFNFWDIPLVKYHSQ